VDDHNNLRHALPSLEDTWTTHRWEIRVFSFLLAITEINIYLALKFFKWTAGGAMTLIEFRRHFSGFLINNPLIPVDNDGYKATESDLNIDCEVVTAPKHAKFFTAGRWIKTATIPYQQYTCRAKGCTKLVRTCCACNMGHWLCTTHIIKHAVDRATACDL
jgi:hypothetical protein